MQETQQMQRLYLKDDRDTSTKSDVERSNRLYDLRQNLGADLVSKIESKHEGMRDRGINIGTIVTLGSAVLGACVNPMIMRKKVASENPEEGISRRDFFANVVLGFGVGSIIGLCGSLIAISKYNNDAWQQYIEGELLPQNKTKEKEIREYLDLRYSSLAGF